jgi:tetratricopeptide (TPR) repeat protein
VYTSYKSKSNISNNLNLDNAIWLAKNKVKKGLPEEAEFIYNNILDKFPQNKRAQKGLASLRQSIKGNADQNPPQKDFDQLLDFYSQGQLAKAVNFAIALTNKYPKAFIVWNILGAANNGLGQVCQASEAFKKVVELNPSYADGHNNLGVTLKDQGKLKDSIKAFEKALSLNPSHAEAHNNMGFTLQSQNKLEDSIKSYKKSIVIKPDYVEAHNNLGIALQGQGKIEEAIVSFNKAISLKPDYAEAHNNMGNALQGQGKIEEAIVSFNKAVSLKPDYAEVYNNMGVALRDKGKLDKAIDFFKKAVSFKSDYADAYNNMGNTLMDQGKLAESIVSFKKAISLKPDYAEAYNNMGVALKDQFKLDMAIDAYNKALVLKPDFAEVYNNMGIALQDQGKLDKVIEAYSKALLLKPDYAEVYNNMGIAFLEQGKLDEAITVYNKALSLNPYYAECFWNLSGTAENISEAKSFIEDCLKANQDHLNAKLTLSALKFYQGDKVEYNGLAQTSLKDHPFMRSFKWIFDLPKLPELYFNRWALFDRIVSLSKKDRPFYEFGVWRGNAFKHLIKTFKKGYGFDTFEGIPEDWHNEKMGTYSSDAKIPEIEGGEFIVGKFEHTLPEFFNKSRSMASVINFDADLYSSTLCALNYSQSVIDQHTILIFDEFLINENWEQDEYKALEDFCCENDLSYEVLAISFFTKQVAVRIIGF